MTCGEELWENSAVLSGLSLWIFLSSKIQLDGLFHWYGQGKKTIDCIANFRCTMPDFRTEYDRCACYNKICPKVPQVFDISLPPHSFSDDT
jgi:hypothetical protein